MGSPRLPSGVQPDEFPTGVLPGEESSFRLTKAGGGVPILGAQEPPCGLLDRLSTNGSLLLHGGSKPILQSAKTESYKGSSDIPSPLSYPVGMEVGHRLHPH